MQTITPTELEGLLATTSGARMVSIIADTDPRMKKRGNPFAGVVIKRTHVNGVVNWSYTKSVNRQRTREGLDAEFRAHPRKWGERMKGTPLVSHVTAGDGRTRLYLELKVERVSSVCYLHTDGREIAKAELAEWLPPPRPESARQETAKSIVLRDYALSGDWPYIGICELRMDSTTYVIDHAPATALRAAA